MLFWFLRIICYQWLRNKSNGNNRWKNISWHLQIILSPYSVVLIFQSVFFSVSERKPSLVTLPQLRSQTKSTQSSSVVFKKTHTQSWLMAHLGLIIVFGLCTKVSHTFWPCKLSISLFWRHFQQECTANCTQLLRYLVGTLCTVLIRHLQKRKDHIFCTE